MIVRIATEDQYELSDESRARLGELDNQVVEAVEAGDEPRFHDLWGKMVELVRRRGVTMDSFLFDDGWDDPSRLWQFNVGFPDGFLL